MFTNDNKMIAIARLDNSTIILNLKLEIKLLKLDFLQSIKINKKKVMD